MYTINKIMSLAGFPKSSIEYFHKAAQTDATKDLLSLASRRYLNKEDCEELLNDIAAQANIHRYSADMLMLLTAACRLGEIYAEKGYSENLFQETLLDLGYKLRECLTVYGIHGTFVLPWFDRFYDCTRFKLGRLQYETYMMDRDFPGFVKKGDTVLNCHIPSCGPITPESILQSLDMAYRFFGYKGTMTVMCASWMLYPPHYPLFPDGSNLQKFYHMFRLAEARSYGENHDAWRLFGTMDADLSKWPRDTALQRNFFDYIRQGNVMGYGRGFLFYTPSSV